MTTSIVTDTTEFDLLGPLPTGTTILEASAGTGKTYAIAGLVVRYVVEDDIPLPSMLVVTFTRAATAELRDRVRARLVGAADHLAAVLAGAPATHPDAVLAQLARAGDHAELRGRHERAMRAIADFDAATISTIHGFCQQVLQTLGLAVDADPDAELVADQSDLVNAVVDDLLIRFATRRNLAEVQRSQLLEIAQKVVANPDARIVPDPHDSFGDDGDDGDGDDGDDGPALPAIRAELAHRIRTELDRRKRARRLLSYDDLLTQLRDALVDPVKGEQAAAALRDRYQVALIDEFQDTDPVQWDILRGAFAVPGGTLVLIGDPKQAIYSFRGADVHAYLDAVAASDDKRTLPVNWRSDGPLLRGLDTLLDGATFGDPRIAYLRVRPAPGHEDSRITGDDPPLRLRCVPRSHGLRGSQGDVNAGAAREHIAADLAAQTVELLSSDTRILTGGDQAADDPDGVEARSVSAGDIAVLVRTNAEAVQVHRALRDVQVPAIINGVGSVFDTPAATEWRRLLEALEQPANGSRARALALTSFLGWSGERVATADEDELARVHDDLHGWAQILRERGVASLFRTLTVATELPERLLGLAGGERHLTDLEHLGQLLHRAAVDDQLGPASLTSWLVQAIAETNDEQVAPEERARRLESDARAVQILTVHRSKGLQYPIVLAPYLWSPGWLHPAVPTFHDAGGRAIDVGGRRDDEAWDDHLAQALDEQFGEGLRLLYVALTRAEHQVIVWWSPCKDAKKSGLGRVLFARDLDGTLDTTATGAIPNDERCFERLGTLAARSEGTLRIEETDRQPQKTPWQPPADEVDHLSAARLSRPLDRAWHRTSYSRITAHAHQPLVGSEPAEDLVDDEELLPTDEDVGGEDAGGEDAAIDATEGDEASLRAVPLPLSDTPGGAEFGTFVHAVLEHLDFATDDLRGALRELTEDELDRRRTRVGDLDTLVEGLARAVETPLGPLAGGRRLRDLTTIDRLNELDFELPLDPRLTGEVTVARIATLLRAHLPAEDPLAGYAAELEAARFDGELRGFLTGSIDLVVRVPGADGAPRYLVADHKTNRLGEWGRPITAWDYRPAALPVAMTRGHYPLQALLYQVALHRYLRWRLPDYDPAAHLGGALYLFLRGMAGDDTPEVDGHPCGVFGWEPPPALVVAISDLLDGGTA
jgi:exodeoxyribonuclease V beta subunit